MANDNPYASPVSAGQMPLNQDKHGQKLATHWERFLGAFVDGLIVGSLNFVAGMYVVAPFFVGVGGFDVTFLVVSAVVGIAVFFAVNGYFLATNGQTIGKMAVGTQIVSESDGQILPFGTARAQTVHLLFSGLQYSDPGRNFVARKCPTYL